MNQPKLLNISSVVLDWMTVEALADLYQELFSIEAALEMEWQRQIEAGEDVTAAKKLYEEVNGLTVLLWGYCEGRFGRNDFEKARADSLARGREEDR